MASWKLRLVVKSCRTMPSEALSPSLREIRFSTPMVLASIAEGGSSMPSAFPGPSAASTRSTAVTTSCPASVRQGIGQYRRLIVNEVVVDLAGKHPVTELGQRRE